MGTARATLLRCVPLLRVIPQQQDISVINFLQLNPAFSSIKPASSFAVGIARVPVVGWFQSLYMLLQSCAPIGQNIIKMHPRSTNNPTPPPTHPTANYPTLPNFETAYTWYGLVLVLAGITKPLEQFPADSCFLQLESTAGYASSTREGFGSGLFVVAKTSTLLHFFIHL